MSGLRLMQHGPWSCEDSTEPRLLWKAETEGEWWQVWCTVAAWFALRLSDLAALRWEHVVHGHLRITAAKTARYGRPDVTVPLIPSESRELILELADRVIAPI